MITNKWKSNISNSKVVQHRTWYRRPGNVTPTRKTFLIIANQWHLLSKNGNSKESHFTHTTWRALGRSGKAVAGVPNSGNQAKSQLLRVFCRTEEEEERKKTERGELLWYKWWLFKDTQPAWASVRGKEALQDPRESVTSKNYLYPEHFVLFRENISPVLFTLYIFLFSHITP